MAKHKKLTKSKSQRIHAKSSALSRYNINFNRDSLNKIVSLIQKGKGILVERQSLRITTWLVSYEGNILYTVYDASRHNIVTFLPIEDYSIDICSDADCKCGAVIR